MESPIAHFAQVLETARDAAQTYALQLQGNEAATRAALVDPILRALGWDIADPARVLVEKTQTVSGSSLRVDYALVHDGDVRIVVEAKKLGGNLADHFLQLVQYSFALHVGSLFITDGLRWQHYENITHDNAAPVRVFDLTQDAIPEIAAYLVQHLDAALVSPEQPQLNELALSVENLQQRLSDLETWKAQMSATPAAASAPVPQTPIAATQLENSQNWVAVSALSEATNTRPIKVKLPDGSEQRVSAWSHVLAAAGRYALLRDSALRAQVPLADAAGKSLQLITLEHPPLHRAATSVAFEGTTFFVCTNYSANGILSNLNYLRQRAAADLHMDDLWVVLAPPKP